LDSRRAPRGKQIKEVEKIRMQVEKSHTTIEALGAGLTKNKPYSADVLIAKARKEELPEIMTLLDQCGLPREGLADHLATTLIAREGMDIVGCSALELYEEYALLRSVAVKETHRRRGLASRLTKAALDLARDHQITTVYLLTETASTFFPKLGFKLIPRSEFDRIYQTMSPDCHRHDNDPDLNTQSSHSCVDYRCAHEKSLLP
jgi:amino-acid N-acetyltransferase